MRLVMRRKTVRFCKQILGLWRICCSIFLPSSKSNGKRPRRPSGFGCNCSIIPLQKREAYSSAPNQDNDNGVSSNPGSLSKEIKEWKVLFDYLFQRLQSDFSMFLSAHELVNSDPIPPMSEEESVQALSKDEAWTSVKVFVWP
jgi:hypothetical protein